MEPYFRHRSLEDCPITQEMKTKAGKRRYAAKKSLYNFALEQDASEIVVEEGKNDWLESLTKEEQKMEVEKMLGMINKRRNVWEWLNIAQ